MRAAIYARVSTEEQTQNFSIENQVERLLKYCSDKEYSVIEEYIDPGYSGTTLKRPALSKMIYDARAKSFEIILVYKLDRLFRSNRHMYNTLAEFEELGIQFASVTESFDTTTAMGKAYLGMASTFAEWERNTFMERSRDGMRKAIQSGQYSGGIVAYGYQLNPDTKRLDVNHEEAEVVHQMYYWLNEGGMNCYTIAERLNALGIPTRYAKDGRGIRGRSTANTWRAGRVYNMLRNTAYKGEWIYGKRSKNRKAERTTGECPAIVDIETFEKAQVRLRDNSLRSDRNAERVYPLRGLIKCELCGHSYCGGHYNTKNGEVNYYRCTRGGLRGGKIGEGCNSLTIPSEPLENLIWQHITDFVSKPKTIQRILERRQQTSNNNGSEKEIQQAEQRVRDLFEAEKRLLHLYADPKSKVSREMLDTQIEEIAQQRDLLKGHISELRESKDSEMEQSRKLESIGFILKQLRKIVKTAKPETKQQVIETLVSKILVNKDDEGYAIIKIIYAFDDSVLSLGNEDKLENREQEFGLGSARMSVRVLRRPLPAMYLPLQPGFQIPEAHQRPLY